jgi:hypothetical protein
VRPCLTLRSITEQVHDDCTLLDRLVDLEQVLAGHPSILNSLFPAGTVFSHTDNNIQAIVAEVQALTVTLRSVPDESEGVVLEVFLAGK